MTRILLTGANGFVGSHLLERLKTENFDVVCALRSPETVSQFEALKIDDIGPHTDWQKALEKVDIVIHLAARAHVMNENATASKKLYMDTNALGTQNLAQQAARQGVQRFIFMSSIKVNGEETPPDAPFTSQVSLPPADPYGLSKLQAEQSLHKICQESAMNYTVIRPPLVYGPGVKANFLSLLGLASKNWPMPFLSLKNKRSMIFVENLTDVIVEIVKNNKADQKTYLPSDLEDLEFRAFYRQLCKAFGHRNVKLFAFPPELLKGLGALCGKKAALERLTQSLTVYSRPLVEDLGWTPPFSQVEAFKITADWYKEN